jgi:hypothetical protein
MISVDEFGNLGFVREKGIAGKNDSLIVGRNFSVGKKGSCARFGTRDLEFQCTRGLGELGICFHCDGFHYGGI